jgi:regulator of sigma E protease
LIDSVLSILPYIFWVILALGILVFAHELGHFLAAKFFGMRVDRFSIGFPPKIFGKQIGETEYVIGATPLGGYVKIAGMIDESLDTDHIDSEPAPWEFRAKPVWQRIIVITAGVIFNMILAGVIYIGLSYGYGQQYVPMENVPYVNVAEQSVAHSMGLRTGDKIVSVNGQELERYEELYAAKHLSADQMTITVDREGERMTFEAPRDLFTQLSKKGSATSNPEEQLGIFRPPIVGEVIEESAAAEIGLQPGDIILSIGGSQINGWNDLVTTVQESGGDPVKITWRRGNNGSIDTLSATAAPQQENGRYLIGISQGYEVERRAYSMPGALKAGILTTGETTTAILQNFKKIVVGDESFRQNIGGPVIIAKVTKEAADQGASRFWSLVAMLSITLAILNILPFPVLDGGHLMFLLYEGIVRREPSVRVRMVLQQIGMVVLLAFMAFVIFNDFLKL